VASILYQIRYLFRYKTRALVITCDSYDFRYWNYALIDNCVNNINCSSTTIKYVHFSQYCSERPEQKFLISFTPVGNNQQHVMINPKISVGFERSLYQQKDIYWKYNRKKVENFRKYYPFLSNVHCNWTSNTNNNCIDTECVQVLSPILKFFLSTFKYYSCETIHTPDS